MMENTISLKPGKVIYSCPLIDQTRSFSEEQKTDAGGKYFSIQVKASVPGSNASNILSLQTMSAHQWGIIAEDRNGVVRLIGNEDSGADLFVKYDTADPKGSRKTELIFSWEHTLPAPIYQGDTFSIIIGGIIIEAGCLKLLMQFEVDAPGAAMAATDTTLTNALFANKRLLILADGIGIPIDYGDGAIDWTGSISRHAEKALAATVATFIGGVVAKEKIEVYAWN